MGEGVWVGVMDLWLEEDFLFELLVEYEDEGEEAGGEGMVR